MKKSALVTVVFLLVGCTEFRQVMFAPPEIRTYCRRIAAGMESRSTCMQQEVAAKERLEGLSIPAHVETYCWKIARSTGGSYQVMMTCIEQEMEAEGK